MPSGVAGRSRSRGCGDGEATGDESTKEDAVGEPPGEEEGDIYARSSGVVKAIFFRDGWKYAYSGMNVWRYMGGGSSESKYGTVQCMRRSERTAPHHETVSASTTCFACLPVVHHHPSTRRT
jgi:hypothetical protein